MSTLASSIENTSGSPGRALRLPVFIPLPGKTRIEFESQCYLGELDGVKAWSNGHVMFTGPVPATASSTKDDPAIWAHALKECGSDLEMPEIQPVALCRALSGQSLIWFSNQSTAVKVDYWAEAYLRFPACTFHCDGIGSHAVVLRQEGRRVGIIMPMNVHRPEWPTEVLELLQCR